MRPRTKFLCCYGIALMVLGSIGLGHLIWAKVHTGAPAAQQHRIFVHQGETRPFRPVSLGHDI